MNSRTLSRSLAVLSLLACAGAAGAADDPTLLRVFLADGTSLVSYGEPARVGDRVVFSMPTASTPNPPLQLVSLSADRVDWSRTDRYAAAARESHYVATQAELDYAALSTEMAKALDDVTQSTDAAKRLAAAQEARKTLAAWPQAHYGYRQAEVRQMLALLDEAIADLRATSGDTHFNLSLSTFVDPPTIAEPLLPLPTPRDVIEQVLLAAQLADAPAERTSLLRTALVGLDRDAAVLPSAWLATTRDATRARVEAEVRIDESYQLLTKRVMTLASQRARAADVRGLERLIGRVQARDSALGGVRPDTIQSLVGAVQAQLDATRRLRLARDRWALRAPAYRQYRTAIKGPLSRLAGIAPSLEQIKSLAGSSAPNLAALERGVAQILKQAGTITPPSELRSAHALLVSAAQLAGNAVSIRREATLAGDIARAWDASSAAAGALMLGTRASADIQALLRPPQLR